jgi:hypothetical protein
LTATSCSEFTIPAHCVARIASLAVQVDSAKLNLFSSPSLLQQIPPDNYSMWINCICNPSFEIPISERAVIMWTWLLWSSNPLPFCISAKLNSALVPESSTDARATEDRLSLLTTLRAKRLITRAKSNEKSAIQGSILIQNFK